MYSLGMSQLVGPFHCSPGVLSGSPANALKGANHSASNVTSAKRQECLGLIMCLSSLSQPNHGATPAPFLSWFRHFSCSVGFLLAGCAPAQSATATAADFDRPVPPGVARADVRLLVDLEPAQDCEEAFDLALYRDRGIDLISWDDAVGSCTDRHVTIRFLETKLNKSQVLDQVRKVARKVSE